jgi:cob(I)alamin adenosyltransferase
MQQGLIHVYYGDGKGKTSAAIGLCIRAAGNGKKVYFAQFLKAAFSGEIEVLRRTNNITVGDLPLTLPFFFEMSKGEQDEYKRYAESVFSGCENAEKSGNDVIVLDEILDAVDLEIIPLQRLLDFLNGKGEHTEIILTGHNANKEIKDAADYVSLISAEKHPYTKGVSARRGIEY